MNPQLQRVRLLAASLGYSIAPADSNGRYHLLDSHGEDDGNGDYGLDELEAELTETVLKHASAGRG